MRKATQEGQEEEKGGGGEGCGPVPNWPHGPWDREYGQHPDLRFCHLSLSKGVLQM